MSALTSRINDASCDQNNGIPRCKLLHVLSALTPFPLPTKPARPNAFFDKTAMLVLDSMTSHKDEEVRRLFKTQHDTILAVIPGGLTKKLQPLDITVNRVFKLHIRESWEQWMAEGLHTYTKTGKMRRATHAEVCNWVLEAWKAVKVSTIVNGFIKATIINGEEDDDEVPDVRDANLDPEIAALFDSDSEDEDFDGFGEDDL